MFSMSKQEGCWNPAWKHFLSSMEYKKKKPTFLSILTIWEPTEVYVWRHSKVQWLCPFKATGKHRVIKEGAPEALTLKEISKAMKRSSCLWQISPCVRRLCITPSTHPVTPFIYLMFHLGLILDSCNEPLFSLQQTPNHSVKTQLDEHLKHLALHLPVLGFEDRG